MPAILTHGHKMYLSAAGDAFGGQIDFAHLVKLYGAVRVGQPQGGHVVLYLLREGVGLIRRRAADDGRLHSTNS